MNGSSITVLYDAVQMSPRYCKPLSYSLACGYVRSRRPPHAFLGFLKSGCHEVKQLLQGLGSLHSASMMCARSAAAILISMGVNSKVVQERLGHSTISITLGVYGHVSLIDATRCHAEMRRSIFPPIIRSGDIPGCILRRCPPTIFGIWVPQYDRSHPAYAGSGRVSATSGPTERTRGRPLVLSHSPPN